MLKKRIIFTLLYAEGFFHLSRNFILQRVGDYSWLEKNYNFSNVSKHIDELIILDVGRHNRDVTTFSEMIRTISRNVFVPIAAGGGIRNLEDVSTILDSGADKVVFNTALFTCPDLVTNTAKKYGQQCVVGSVDIKKASNGSDLICISNGEVELNQPISVLLRKIPSNSVGELLFTSIDRDGTGDGYDLSMLSYIPLENDFPIIIQGGAGHSRHFSAGLSESKVDAVATAHLFNFVADGLKNARYELLEEGVPLATRDDFPC